MVTVQAPAARPSTCGAANRSLSARTGFHGVSDHAPCGASMVTCLHFRRFGWEFIQWKSLILSYLVLILGLMVLAK
jgi:hypothetical protein